MKSVKELLDEAEARQSYVNEDNPYSKYYHMNNTASPRSYDYPDIALLDKQIAEIEAKIKERDANKVQQPKTMVGWASYIVNNDRGLLDKYQDAERAWYNKLADQEQAKALANTQMEQQAAYRMDDNMKNRSLALNKLQYAEAALKNDTSNDPVIKAGLERDVRNAKEELKYWNKAVGIEDKEINNTAINEIKEDVKKDIKDDTRTTEVKIEDYSSITKFNNQAQKDSILKEMESNPALDKNPAFKREFNRIKEIIPEDKKAADYAARKVEWRKEFDAKSPLQQRKWKKDNPAKAKAIGV